jgi:hypothetical protein
MNALRVVLTSSCFVLSLASVLEVAADTDVVFMGSLAEGRYSHMATLLLDGEVLVAGGSDCGFPGAEHPSSGRP